MSTDSMRGIHRFAFDKNAVLRIQHSDWAIHELDEQIRHFIGMNPVKISYLRLSADGSKNLRVETGNQPFGENFIVKPLMKFQCYIIFLTFADFESPARLIPHEPPCLTQCQFNNEQRPQGNGRVWQLDALRCFLE
jgi:hypothetical protein